MPYKVAIRKNATGEIRIYTSTIDWHESAHFLWTDGNYACDCNRELFFARAGGEDPTLEEVQCGDTKFAALYAEMEDGTRIKLDEDATCPSSNSTPR